jgi:PBSX family phage terminase large subunit
MLDDNPAITEERKEEIRRQYTGVFYQRYILGRRVRAEGAIYTNFHRERHIRTIPSSEITYAVIGGDIGGNKSATDYILVGFFFKDGHFHVHVIDELYDKDNLSTESIIDNFEQFAISAKRLYTVSDAYVDSAEQLIIKSMRNLGFLNVRGSKKIGIIDRIRLTDYLFSVDRLTIDPRCIALIDAFETAVWDPKGQKEERLDDGSSNIDSLDAFEYTIERQYKELMQ